MSSIYVVYENSFDAFHKNRDRMVRVVTSVNSNGSISKTALANGFLADLLQDEFPEVEAVIRLKRLETKALVKTIDDREAIQIDNIYYADPLFFNVFDFELIEGRLLESLATPKSIVLTKSLAIKLFGSSGSAIGQSVQFPSFGIFEVTGVVEDPPGNSNLRFEALFSSTMLDDIDWGFTYILLNRTADVEDFEAKFQAFSAENIEPLFASEGVEIKYQFENLDQIHFGESLLYDADKGNRTFVNIFFVLGILVLMVTGINYFNLTTIKSYMRANEINVQKVFGASPIQIARQFIFESLILVSIAILTSFLLALIIQPSYASLLDIEMGLSDLFNSKILLYILGSLLLLSLSGSLYLIFMGRNYNISEELKSKGTGRSLKTTRLSRIILGLQFFITVFAIIGGGIVYKQVRHLHDAPLGFNYENVLVIELPTEKNEKERAEILQLALAKIPEISQSSICGYNALPSQDPSVEIYEYTGNKGPQKRSIRSINVDQNYLDVLEIPVIEGSSFDVNGHDSTVAQMIMPQILIEELGWSTYTNKNLEVYGMALKVTGVSSNFRHTSLYKPAESIAMIFDTEYPAYLLLKFDDTIPADYVFKEWNGVFPGYPLNTFYLEDFVLGQYDNERNLSALLFAFSVLIILISCVGLIAYYSFLIRHNKLALAVKLTLGVSFLNVFKDFAVKFLPIFLIAYLFSAVFSWYFMNEWLQNFEDRTSTGFWVFFIPIPIVLTIVFGVIFYFTTLGMRTNVVATLRES